MNRDQGAEHSFTVKEWVVRSVKDLPIKQQLLVFSEAIHAIHNRALKTLSEVTVSAVIERALHECQLKFPLLYEAKIVDSRISLDELLPDFENLNPDEFDEAVGFFIVELLTILENITGGTLTGPLYKELSQVTFESAVESRKDRGVV